MKRKTIVDRLRKFLESSELSLSEISRRSEIHPVQLSRFKTGTHGLGAEAMERLANAMGYRVDFAKEKKSDIAT